MSNNKVNDALLGIATGDAIGVPFEFSSRDQMKENPAKDMIGFGTYNQPKGTWSDDSSLTFCLANSLLEGYDLVDISKNFIKWKNEAYWSARGKVFDIGNTTAQSISELEQILKSGNTQDLKTLRYLGNEFDNGNGSLMRIMPLLFYIQGKNIKEQFDIVWEVSALTHKHIRAAMSCLIYLKIAENIIQGSNKEESYLNTRNQIIEFWNSFEFSKKEREHFKRIIQGDIRDTKIDDLKSGGYVIEVLESSIWFFLNRNSYSDIILSIINIGHDTDTSAAIAGGLAGLFYSTKDIPNHWIQSLARLDDIMELGDKLNKKYCA